MQTNDECYIELFEIEMFDHLTVSKQMSDSELNCQWLQYLEPFNFVDFV